MGNEEESLNRRLESEARLMAVVDRAVAAVMQRSGDMAAMNARLTVTENNLGKLQDAMSMNRETILKHDMRLASVDKQCEKFSSTIEEAAERIAALNTDAKLIAWKVGLIIAVLVFLANQLVERLKIP